jgi:hypothetical protein
MNGMTNMEVKGLSAKDICQIIKSCKQAGVENLKLADIEIRFSSQRNESAPTHRNGDAVVVEEEFPPTEDPQPLGNADLMKQMDEQAVSEAEESQLAIEDPLAYERHIIRRDIERNRDMMNG